MDEKLKIFWNLDVLVKMCRSKSDGPSLRVEEEEILEKISNYESDIDEIKSMLDEDTYDTSAEMADRNIEIITKKQLQSLKAELKEKNKELNKLKDDENILYNQTSLLRENKASNEKYITSMQERLSESTDREVLDRYNSLITETLTKINELTEQLREENTSYEEVQTAILQASADVEDLEARIDKKKKLLAETQASLENKENYIDKSKREKNNKKIEDIESKIENLQQRLEEIRKDPKYIETKIKDVINSKEDKENARDYLSELVQIVIDQPYINVPTDNALEEELLRATQARDSFANEIDQKSYNILEANTPEKIRTDFLNKRIENWREELNRLHSQINLVDKDDQYNYEEKDRQLEEMIRSLKNDLKEFEKAYAETSDTNIGAKASLEVALEEKKEDIQEAEKIANAFKTNEAEDIANATRTIKYQCEQLNNDIKEAEEEIKRIRNRLMSRKSGLIDIAARNKDKDVLRDLAQTVIDIKHRRQFPETPLDIIKRLEEELDITILTPEDMEKINQTSTIVSKNYDEYISKKYEIPARDDLEDDENPLDNFSLSEDKELTNVDIMNPEDLIDNNNKEEDFQKLANLAMGVEAEEPAIEEPTNEEPKEIPEETEESTEETIEEPPVEEEPVEETEESEESEETSEQPEEENQTEKEISDVFGEIDDQPEEQLEEQTEEPSIEEPSIEEETEESTEETIEEPPVEEEPVEETEESEETPESSEENVSDIEEPQTEDVVEEEIIEELPMDEGTEEVEENSDENVSEEIIEEIPLEENEVSEEDNATEESEDTPVEEESPETENTEDEISEPPAIDDIVAEEPPVEEQPVEETATEEPTEEPSIEESPVEEPVEEPQTEEVTEPVEEVAETPVEEEPVEETTSTAEEVPVDASEIADISVGEIAEEQPVEEPSVEETATEEAPVEEAVPAPEAPAPMEDNNEPQENPFGDAEPATEPATEPAPADDVTELASNIGDDLSINSMFSNSIELSDEKNNEEVRNNLSDELDSFLNNLDDNK